MLRCLGIFDPSRWCFTASDFDDALIDIDGILEEILADYYSSHLSLSERKRLLEKAYSLATSCLSLSSKQKPDKQLIFLLADIFKYYGIVCHDEGDFFESKQILLTALNLHFFSIGIQDQCIDILEFNSLQDLKKHPQDRLHTFASIELAILDVNSDHCLSAAYISTLAQAYSSRRLSSLAQICRWLILCYQNLESYQSPKPKNIELFKQLLTLSEGLYILSDNNEATKELAELYFQASAFIYQLQHPASVEKICRIYNQALACDSSTEIDVKVADMRFCKLYEAGKKEKALPYILQAINSLDKLKATDCNRRLIARVHHHYATYLIDPENPDLDKGDHHLSLAIQCTSAIRLKGDDHPDFALYDIEWAKVKFISGEFLKAKEGIERAFVTINKFSSKCPKIYKDNAIGLKSLIDKVLAMQDLRV